eukprot:scaffold612007_cov130-Attheya_sp.AAC.1
MVNLVASASSKSSCVGVVCGIRRQACCRVDGMTMAILTTVQPPKQRSIRTLTLKKRHSSTTSKSCLQTIIRTNNGVAAGILEPSNPFHGASGGGGPCRFLSSTTSAKEGSQSSSARSRRLKPTTATTRRKNDEHTKASANNNANNGSKKMKKLMEETSAFLKKESDGTLTYKDEVGQTVLRLVGEWGPYWGRDQNQHENDTETDSSNHHRLRHQGLQQQQPLKFQFHPYILVGVEQVDQMVHLLLDRMELKEVERRRQDQKDELSNYKTNIRKKKYVRTESARTLEQLCTVAICGWSKTSGATHPPITNENPKQKHHSMSPAERANRTLERMETLYDEYQILQPNVHIYNIVIHAYASQQQQQQQQQPSSSLGDNRTNLTVVPQVLELVTKMKHLSNSGHNKRAKPDIITYNSVLSAMAKAGNASQAQELLHEMRSTIDTANANNATTAGTMVQPDAISYATVMNAWRLSGEKGAASRARILLEDMIQKSQHVTHLTPTAGTFGTVLALYAKEMNASEAHSVLHQMLDMYAETGSPIPESAHFATVMNAWTKSGQMRIAAEKVQDLFIRMEQLHDSGHAHLKPNQQCYTMVIDAWAKSYVPGAAQYADEILKRMQQVYLHPATQSEEPLSAYGYNVVMAAYARSKDDRAVEHIQRIIHDMEELSQGSESSGGNPQIAPDRISYTTLMRAHISLGKAGFADRVESILRDLRQQESNPLAKPDERMYSVVLDAWDRSGDPNAHTRAEALVLQMNDDFVAGNKLVQPTVVCMNSLLNTYPKINQTGAAETAELLLSWMEDESRSGKNKMMKPDTISYSTCIETWANSSASDKFDRAESLMERMIQQCTEDSQSGETVPVKPDVATWNGLLSVLVSSNVPRGPRKGQLILERMHKMGIVPNQISYASLLRMCSHPHYSRGSEEDRKEALEIGAWAKSSTRDEFYRAESIMERMIQQCTEDSQSGETVPVKPNVATWNGLLSVLVSSNVPRGPRKGQLILERMHTMGIVPNQISYVSLLRICSRLHSSRGAEEDRKEALEIALTIFDRMRSNGFTVDSMTYLTLIQICDNLIVDTKARKRVIVGVFHKCCQDGQVNEEVMSRFQHVLSRKLFSSLLSQVLPNSTAESFNISDLPREWTEGTQTPAKFTN